MANKKTSFGDLTRRDFIKATGITSAAIIAGVNLNPETRASDISRPASARIIGANGRIRYGFVGLGGMGSGHLNIIKGLTETENVEIVAVCDVFEKRRREAQVKSGVPENQGYADYRRLLERKDIDVVVIATPDHWHSQIALDALDSGKHIYLEKPMTRTLEEAFKVYDMAKRTGLLVQVGSHGCSDPKWLKARDVIKSGKLGKLLWAQASYCRNNPKGEWNYKFDPEANAQTVDWKQWLGKTPKRDWSPERYFRWRKYWDYANGIIGDLWPHRLHPLMLAMNLNEFPKQVSCMGGILLDTDKGNGEPRDVADTTMMTAEYPSGAMIFVAGSTVNERGVEDVIRGQKANLLFGGGKVELLPERPYVDEIEGRDETPPDSGESHLKHQKNFIDSLRSDREPSCNIELAIRVQTVVSLAEMSYRKGKTMHFDTERRKAD
jgi:predicted dehydrogenase